MKLLKRILEFYNQFEEIVLVIMLSASVIMLFINVILRYLFNSSLYGVDELARVLFIWMSWLGISIGERKSEHICIDMLVSKFHGIPEKIIKTLASLVTLFILMVLVYYGMDVVNTYLRKGVTTPMYKIPQALVYFSVPYSCAIMGLRLILNSIGLFTSKKDEGGSEK